MIELEISRFPYKERPYMPGSQTTQGRSDTRADVSVRVAFRVSYLVSTLRKNHFRGSMAGLYVPLPTLRRYPHGCLRTAWGQCGSLLLHCDGLAPPAPCRSPGAQPIDFIGSGGVIRNYNRRKYQEIFFDSTRCTPPWDARAREISYTRPAPSKPVRVNSAS